MSHRRSFLLRLLSKEFRHHPLVMLVVSTILIGISVVLLWVSTLKIPDLGSFEQRRVSQSTKIYDRTGEIVLYDVFSGAKRTVVPWNDISRNIKNATVAIEDDTFYKHNGVRPLAFLRAAFVNLLTGAYSQGGSTITQQVVKNSLLTKEKTITRKIKEWVLAIKLEQVLSKEEILAAYLNETPYGGNLYGVEEASKQFFGKDAKDLTITEAAYMAAIPQATTYYSPYGKNREALDTRKTLVLEKMLENNFITKKEYDLASKEVITFKPQEEYGIKAPHFVLFVKDWLAEKFGEETMIGGGLKVITTLDYKLQERAEEIVKKTALSNEENFDAKNAALVALDPRNGDIVTMVGSRDYFDEKIDGNYNIITGSAGGRQPGSSFKPIVYAAAFTKGYTPETVLFDLKTEFSSLCDDEGRPLKKADDPKKVCYSPGNYDDVFRGPITLRSALAQSINIPSVKLLYLVGIKEALDLAKNMGITTLTNKDQYGLTLVLGGGEVTPLELTSAYGTFANNGTHMESQSVIRVEDSLGNMIYEKKDRGFPVLEENTTKIISDILSDNNARTPSYGANSVLYFPGFDVAVKTGTSNDYRDAWTVGYTPFLVIGAWAGNNDNSPMQKKVAGQIVAPMWSEFMRFALSQYPKEFFKKPIVEKRDLKPVFRGIWQGGETYEIDSISGKKVTEYTPEETKVEKVIPAVHSILYWVDKNDISGPALVNPNKDPQFSHWEKPVREWASKNGFFDGSGYFVPTETDDVHLPGKEPVISVSGIDNDSVINRNTSPVSIKLRAGGFGYLTKIILYLNGSYIETIDKPPFETEIYLDSVVSNENNELKVVGYNSVFNKGEKIIHFKVID